jgi:hypothetical protein
LTVPSPWRDRPANGARAGLFSQDRFDGKGIDQWGRGPNDRARPRCRRRLREDSVLVDHRTYRIKPGRVPAHLELYEKHGLTAQTRHLGSPVAYLFAESGELNTVVHIWGFESAADREQKRAAMFQDPEWQNYMRLNNESGNLVEMKTSLMIPTKFAPLKR